MTSIRRAVLWRLVLGTGALVVCATLGFTLGARRLLTRQFDTALEAKLDLLLSLCEQDGPFIEFEADEARVLAFETGTAPEYFELWIGERRLARSPTLGEHDLPRRFGADGEALTFDLELPSGRAGRAIGAEVAVVDYEPSVLGDPGPQRVTLVVARERAELDAALFALLAGTAVGSLLLLLCILWLGARVVDRGLAPVKALVEHVQAIDDPTEASAYPVQRTAVELQPIAAGVNLLVERLAAEFQRERRAAANIAHELRTPVSELVILSEVALQCSEEPERALEALREVRDVGRDMWRMIGTLLELARLESGQTPLEPERIDLAELLAECWQPFAEEALARRLTFELCGDRPAVEADRCALGMLCSNLLGNAVDHAPTGSRIECVIEERPEPSVCLSNPANGLREEDMDKLAEPFWRASTAREDRGHAGLGLALARRLANLLRARLEFGLEEGLFRVKLGLASIQATALDRRATSVPASAAVNGSSTALERS